MNLKIESKQSAYIVLVILVSLGLAIRTYGIGRLDFWYDEMGMWLYSLTGSPFPHSAPTEPPLMPWLMYIWMWWMKSGDSFHIHFLPAVLGSLAIPVSYLFAAKVDDSRITGLVAAALTTLSPMAIFYSREGRPYALFILVSSSLYLSFIWAHLKNSKPAWLSYSLLLCLSGLSHLLTAEIGVVLLIFAIATRFIAPLSSGGPDLRARRFIHFLLFSFAGGVGILWILLRPSGPVRAAFSGIYQFGLLSYFRTVLVNLGPGPVRPYTDWSFGPSEFLAILFFLLFLAGLRRLHQSGRDDLVLLFVLACSVPMVIKYFTLGFRGDAVWVRWISHTLLPFLVVVSIGFESIRRLLKNAYIQVVLAALFMIGILRVAVDLPENAEYNEFKRIARYTKENSVELEGVLILPYRQGASGGDLRITNIYFYLKRELLPAYHVTDGEIRKVALAPSLGNITQIARADNHPESRLESGKYAVLWRRPLEACDDIARTLKNIKAIVRESSPIMEGLTVCDFDFSETGSGDAAPVFH